MPVLRSEAFVLGRTPYSETSWIATLFTREEGILRVVARGGRRPRSAFSGSLEPLTRVHAEASGKEDKDLWTLRKCDAVQGAMGLFEDWRRSGVLFGVIEVLERGLPERHPEEKTYRLTGTILQGLEAGVDPAAAWVYFLVWFLRLHGLFPRPDRCAACDARTPGPDGRLHFSREREGWVCERCAAAPGAHARTLPPDATEILGGIFSNPLPALVGKAYDRPALKMLADGVYLAVTDFLGAPLRTEGAREKLFESGGTREC